MCQIDGFADCDASFVERNHINKTKQKKYPKNKTTQYNKFVNKYVYGFTPRTLPVYCIQFRHKVSRTVPFYVSNACVDDFASIDVSTKCCVSHSRHESTYCQYWVYDEGKLTIFILRMQFVVVLFCCCENRHNHHIKSSLSKVKTTNETTKLQ